MRFTHLRLHGFKSFSDATELLIEPGMTGIVGPNGCGKSNIVEAIRWVMGESSAKRMRGMGMDDVIFAGAKHRPSRNIAEVTLTLEKSSPSDEQSVFHDYFDDNHLEISRRISRGGGSNYRLNGQEVRARDVQLLFADLATGAGSTAIVSQGRIGALISAAPTERRLLLEEAAGIRGLHTRRHEAKLRLDATLRNLERIEDAIGQLNTQYEAMQKQVRQAKRYRRLGEQIRAQKATLSQKKWSILKQQRADINAKFDEKQNELAIEKQALDEAKTSYEAIKASLPKKREDTAQFAANRQALATNKMALEAEKQTIKQEIENLTQRLNDTGQDLQEQQTQLDDANKTLATYEQDLQKLEQALKELPDQISKYEAEFNKAAAELKQNEAEYHRLNREITMKEAAHSQQLELIEKIKTTLEAIPSQIDHLQSQDTKADKFDEQNDRLKQDEAEAIKQYETANEVAKQAEDNLQNHSENLRKIRTEYDEATRRHQDELTTKRQSLQDMLDKLQAELIQERDSKEAEEKEGFIAKRAKYEQDHHLENDKLRNEQAKLELELKDLSLEYDRLKAIFESEVYEQAATKRLRDELPIKDGFEAIIAALFGPDLDLKINDNAPSNQDHDGRFWRALDGNKNHESALPIFPDGIAPLIDELADTPSILHPYLRHVGLAKDQKTAYQAQNHLKPGMAITTSQGGLWRWDGLVENPGSQALVETKLKQSKRYQELQISLPEKQKNYDNEKKKIEERLMQSKHQSEKEIEALKAKFDQSIAKIKEDYHLAWQQKEANLRHEQQAQIASAQEALKILDAKRMEAQNAYDQARKIDEEARQTQQKSYHELQNLRGQLMELQNEREKETKAEEERLSRLNALKQQQKQLGDDLQTEQQKLKQYDDIHDQKTLLNQLDEALKAARQQEYQAHSQLQNSKTNETRLGKDCGRLKQDIQHWTARKNRISERMMSLQDRIAEIQNELQAKEQAPEALEGEINILNAKIEDISSQFQAANDDLKASEQALQEHEYRLKELERHYDQAKESLIRLEGHKERVSDQYSQLKSEIYEQFNGMEPDDLVNLTEIADSDDLPDEAIIEGRLQKLERERENLGSVNLRAEDEALILHEEIERQSLERDDLTNAVSRLEEAIKDLNKEGKQRLKQAFISIDTHFQSLFKTLFGGGEASLRLLEDGDDPLATGLEILARPPGKKMQILSLLSGGEQALTALSLLFALFMTNPSPICILDEVDAPLDDANVGRFIKLLQYMVKNAETRFLIVTHHRLTMAEADRLYGVTMAEDGVSQLVSVDLRQATDLAE